MNNIDIIISKSLFNQMDLLYNDMDIMFDYIEDTTYYKVIFGLHNKVNNIDITSTIYYNQEQNIKVGMLLKFKKEVYFVLNKKVSENVNYYKSDIIKCNGILEIPVAEINKGIKKQLNIPVVFNKELLKSQDGKIISEVDGIFKVYGSADMIFNIEFTYLRAFGIYFEVFDKYVIDKSICYILLKRVPKNPNIKFEDGNNNSQSNPQPPDNEQPLPPNTSNIVGEILYRNKPIDKEKDLKIGMTLKLSGRILRNNVVVEDVPFTWVYECDESISKFFRVSMSNKEIQISVNAGFPIYDDKVLKITKLKLVSEDKTIVYKEILIPIKSVL